MTEDILAIPETPEERQALFEIIETMLERDFGCPIANRFSPFNVTDTAHLGLIYIKAAYEDFDEDSDVRDPDELAQEILHTRLSTKDEKEVDAIAERILAERKSGNPDIENIIPS